MDFSKPKNFITLIISLLVILSLSINVTWSWFNFTSEMTIDSTVSVLFFDFRTNDKYSEDVTVTLSVETPTNYVSGYIAPGVKGYHTFNFSNANSDVPVKYTVTFNRNKSTFPTNMVFYRDSSYTDESLINNIVWENVSLAKGAVDNTHTFGFEWKYYETDDENEEDKAFINDNSKIELNFTITAYQA